MAPQDVKDIRTVEISEGIIWAFIPKAGPAVGIDVIHHEGYILLCIPAEIFSFRDTEPYELVVPFRRPFLVGGARVAIENPGTGISFKVMLYR